MICRRDEAPFDALRTLSGLATCCMGASLDGPMGCTCWEPEYDLDQAPVVPAEPATRHIMCATCAYRTTSPERSGDPNYEFAGDELPDGETPFWCHQGMRKPLRWRHRSLRIVIEATGDYYAPPQVVEGNAAVPYKADGTPGDRCAGWAAARRRLSCTTDELLAEAQAATNL